MTPQSPYLIHGKSYAILLMCLGTLTLAVTTFAVLAGSVTIPAREVFDIIAAHAAGKEHSNPAADRIIWHIRTPRALTAIVVGVALTLAGAALQAITRNPVADPYILGAGPGAAMGAVFAMTLPMQHNNQLSVPIAAFAGSMVALLAVLACGRRGGMLSPVRMVLTGVAVGYLCNAVTNYLQLKASPTKLSGVLHWLLGSLTGSSWAGLAIPVMLITGASIFVLLRWRTLDALTFGDETATNLGVNVARNRLVFLILTSILTGAAVATAGGIVFVGLVAPHIARMLVGPSHGRLLPVALLTGAMFLVLVDLAARTIEAPNELPVSIFTAFFGAPFFLLLLRKERAA